MMVRMYKHHAVALTHEELHLWHRMLFNGRRDLEALGEYRKHEEPMQIVSGPIGSPKIHFVAPPSGRVEKEMEILLNWLIFSSSKPKEYPPILRAGIAHVWFESIHPFEDGNGRIGRTIAEKILAEATDVPQLILLSSTIRKRKKEYYEQLKKANVTLDMTGWLQWFSSIVKDSQRSTVELIQFIVEKTKLFRRLDGKLNSRQEKVILRLFQAGPEGFVGGISANNYKTIAGATAPTATRDLRNLVEIGALFRTGDKKSTRYWLNIRYKKAERN